MEIGLGWRVRVGRDDFVRRRDEMEIGRLSKRCQRNQADSFEICGGLGAEPADWGVDSFAPQGG